MRKILLSGHWLLLLLPLFLRAQTEADSIWLLKPDRVFDGTNLHTGWQVLVQGRDILKAGPHVQLPAGGREINLPGCTLLPGLIEGHSHLFLHPYNEVPWNDQVLKESRAERTARATVHAWQTLRAGFTTVRDLGTEGAMYDDAGLKQAIAKGVVPGPHMLVATRAIVATGSYGPKLGNADFDLPKGAAEADGVEGITREVRLQIGKGADVVKLYGDYRWGPGNTNAPTFTEEEIRTAVEVASASGRYVAVHANTAEAMRRAALAGVRTIEHGDEGTLEVFELMKTRGVAYCPTIAAVESLEQYRGWRKGRDPDPLRVQQKKKSFALALQSGVIICMGGDVGVFPHGDNALEMECMVEYGMKPLDVLRSATSVNADVFGIGGQFGRIETGYVADLLVVKGDPASRISDVRQVIRVMKEGSWVFGARN